MKFCGNLQKPQQTTSIDSDVCAGFWCCQCKWRIDEAQPSLWNRWLFISCSLILCPWMASSSFHYIDKWCCNAIRLLLVNPWPRLSTGSRFRPSSGWPSLTTEGLDTLTAGWDASWTYFFAHQIFIYISNTCKICFLIWSSHFKCDVLASACVPVHAAYCFL